MKQLMKCLGLLLMSVLLLLPECKLDFRKENRGVDVVDMATIQSQSNDAPSLAVPGEGHYSQWKIPKFTGDPYAEINGNIPFSQTTRSLSNPLRHTFR